MKINKLAFLLLLTCLISCTSEADKKAQARQERIEREEKEAQDKKNEETMKQLEAQHEAERAREIAEEAAKPKEPEYEEIEVRTFWKHDVDAAKGVTCKVMEDESACGISFSDCDDGAVYRCLNNVKYVKKTIKVLVNKDN